MSVSCKRILLLVVAGAASAATAQAATARPAVSPAHTPHPAVLKVHGQWGDEDGRWQRGRHHGRIHGRTGRQHYVEAPFTYVETGDRVVVDAPFAHVSVDRHGRHIRAPFVNLWLPR